MSFRNRNIGNIIFNKKSRHDVRHTVISVFAEISDSTPSFLMMTVQWLFTVYMICTEPTAYLSEGSPFRRSAPFPTAGIGVEAPSPTGTHHKTHLYQTIFYFALFYHKNIFMSRSLHKKMSEIIKNMLTETTLLTEDFAYDLPPELIAQVPAEKRDCSRLMVMDRKTGCIEHKHFYDIIDQLSEGDVLVLNRSRVIPARLYGKRADTGADIEILLLRRLEGDRWEALVKPGKKCKISTVITFGDGVLCATVADITEDGNRILDFTCNSGSVSDAIHTLGQMPLPPYITSRASEKERYQTVYSKEEGSAAAPTAGLHFTPELLDRIEKKGVKVVTVLLHVGLGTFRPVKERKIQNHVMHSEWFCISEDAARTINERKGRLIAVGTTSCRVLESVSDENGKVHAGEGETAIFIYPGYRFKAIEGLITNFHLPESTLIMLVSAFSTRENVINAYKTAVKEKYRFFSFGDSMFIR